MCNGRVVNIWRTWNQLRPDEKNVFAAEYSHWERGTITMNNVGQPSNMDCGDAFQELKKKKNETASHLLNWNY